MYKQNDQKVQTYDFKKVYADKLSNQSLFYLKYLGNSLWSVSSISLNIFIYPGCILRIFYIKPYMHVYKSKYITSTQLSVNYLEVDIFM